MDQSCVLFQFMIKRKRINFGKCVSVPMALLFLYNTYWIEYLNQKVALTKLSYYYCLTNSRKIDEDEWMFVTLSHKNYQTDFEERLTDSLYPRSCETIVFFYLK